MSLYHDAATVLSSASHSQGSLRSRIYDGNITIKSSPQLVYGLVTECAKWDIILSEVIDNARMMSQEPKVCREPVQLVLALLTDTETVEV